MSKLITLTDLNATNFISMIKDVEIIIYENIQASKIFMNYNGSEFILKARTLDSQPINCVDLALQKYYNKAVNYFNRLDDKVKVLLNTEWWYCFQYFYDNQPSNIKYDKIPKNSLILTSIIKNDNFIFDADEISEYSELLDIPMQPIMFRGVLTDKQIDLINYFLQTSVKDLDYIFGDENFANFFYKILSPNHNNSILMNDGEFHENIEKMIIKINGSDEISFALLNPLYIKSDNGKSEHVDIYSILLLELLEFIETVEISDIVLVSTSYERLYLELMSKIFNSYCNHRSDKITNFEFDIPPFFYEDKFKINVDLIENEYTKNIIRKDDKLEYLFKILLTSFRSIKKKPIGIFTTRSLEIFNNVVKDIEKTIDKKLKIEREEVLNRDELLDFGKFYSIQYPKDGAGEVYPDLYKELGQSISSSDKSKQKQINKK